MKRVFRFHKASFDISAEHPNPINPIPGQSLPLWLAEHAKPEASMSVPAPEDWGWYSDVVWNGRHYMIGASASPKDSGSQEWVLQVNKSRSLFERALGRERMVPDDACASFSQRLLESEPAFEDLTIDS